MFAQFGLYVHWNVCIGSVEVWYLIFEEYNSNYSSSIIKTKSDDCKSALKITRWNTNTQIQFQKEISLNYQRSMGKSKGKTDILMISETKTSIFLRVLMSHVGLTAVQMVVESNYLLEKGFHQIFKPWNRKQ